MWKLPESGDDSIFESTVFFPQMISPRRKKNQILFSHKLFSQGEKHCFENFR